MAGQRMETEAPLIGITQWFAFEERTRVARAVDALADLRIQELRTLFSWADWCRPGGPAWFDWFIGKLSEVPNLTLLPALFYTPPHLARKDQDGKQKTSYPPEDLNGYTQFVRTMIERYGEHFDWVQLWNEPNWNVYWSWDMDPYGDLFAAMAIDAADAARGLGKKVNLGGTTPLDFSWFTRMHEHELLERVDAVAFHYSPSWPDAHRHWQPFGTEIHTLRALLAGLGASCEVWAGEVGFSTHTKEDADEGALEHRQVEYFDAMCALPVERVYWHALLDEEDSATTDDAINLGSDPDPTANHFGLITMDGRKKPLYQHWKKLNETI